MRHRKEIPLAEALALIDAYIGRTKSMQAFLKGKRVPVGHIDHEARARKTKELRVERMRLEWIRRDLSSLRYGPKSTLHNISDLLKVS